MTISPPALADGGRQQPLRLVLAALGRRPAIAALMEAAAPALAAALALRLRALTPPEAPSMALAGLHSPTADADSGWLAPLPLDPGLPLPASGCWAEALGAWRQPCLLLVRGDELDTGRPAAAAALLCQWRAPLLGLVQWGGEWCDEERRADALPWLGWLPRPDDAPGEPAPQVEHEASRCLLAASSLPLLRLRLAQLDLA
jgi:hypothetical protein